MNNLPQFAHNPEKDQIQKAQPSSRTATAAKKKMQYFQKFTSLEAMAERIQEETNNQLNRGRHSCSGMTEIYVGQMSCGPNVVDVFRLDA